MQLLIESERAGGRLWRPLLGKASVRSIAGRVGAGDQGHVCSGQALMVPSHTSQLPHRHVRRGRLGPQHRLRREQVLAGFSTSRNSSFYLSIPLLSWAGLLRQLEAR